MFDSLSIAFLFMWPFYFLAAVSLWLGVLSLLGGVRFVRYLKAEIARSYPEYTPFLTLFVPCRGMDEGLAENIAALLTQDYPAFEIIFVSDRVDDPALATLAEACRSLGIQVGESIRFVIAGAATDSGQKVHNLSVAVGKANPKSEIFAFVDTDARPHSRWLRSLVAPLQDETIGATTGYRWFVPPRPNFAAHLRSVWNASIASALGENSGRNFCWGGSTAIRRQRFESLEIVAAWRGTVSDDFALTRELQKARAPIKFVPACLTPSFENCDLHDLLEFTTRQLKITRAYAAKLWKAMLFGSALFAIVFWGGLGLVMLRAARGLSFAVPLAILFVIFLLGALKSYLRLRAVRLVIPDPRLRSPGNSLAHLGLWPIASLLFLYNSLAAAVSRRITWRGITYELQSPTKMMIQRD